MKKVHPDLNSNISNAESSSRMTLISKFKNDESSLMLLCESWGYSYIDEDDIETSEDFNFPYPNTEFRVSDYVFTDNEIWIINSITKDNKLKNWVFILENVHDETKKTVYKESLNSGKDRNFYLYDIRKTTDKQIIY